MLIKFGEEIRSSVFEGCVILVCTGVMAMDVYINFPYVLIWGGMSVFGNGVCLCGTYLCLGLGVLSLCFSSSVVTGMT